MANIAEFMGLYHVVLSGHTHRFVVPGKGMRPWRTTTEVVTGALCQNSPALHSVPLSEAHQFSMLEFSEHASQKDKTYMTWDIYVRENNLGQYKKKNSHRFPISV